MNWTLFDCRRARRRRPQWRISSEEQLRKLFEPMIEEDPGILIFGNPFQETLQIGLGNWLGGVAWLKPPIYYKKALASDLVVPENVEFSFDGQPSALSPEHLLYATETIEIVVYFLNTHELAPWVSWEEWIHPFFHPKAKDHQTEQ